eukprot:5547554-Karenia_brevis.AAC.1
MPSSYALPSKFHRPMGLWASKLVIRACPRVIAPEGMAGMCFLPSRIIGWVKTVFTGGVGPLLPA